MNAESDEFVHEGQDVKPRIILRADGFRALGLRSNNSAPEMEAAALLFAFACELYLKGLSAGQGHDLANLYADLDIRRQNWLSSKYEDSTGNDLGRDMASCSDIFVKLRYYHEQTGQLMQVGLVEKLSRFLSVACAEAIKLRMNRTLVVKQWPALGSKP